MVLCGPVRLCLRDLARILDLPTEMAEVPKLRLMPSDNCDNDKYFHAAHQAQS